MHVASGSTEIVEDPLDPRWIGAWYPRELWHFHSQLLARYGIVLEPGEFTMIKDALATGKALVVEARPDGQVICSIRIPRAREQVYVLAHGGRLITAWPPERRLNEIRRRLKRETARPPGDGGTH